MCVCVNRHIAESTLPCWILDSLGVCVLSTADAEEDLSDILMKQSCITMQTQFFFDNRDERSFKGTLDCDNCSR